MQKFICPTCQKEFTSYRIYSYHIEVCEKFHKNNGLIQEKPKEIKPKRTRKKKTTTEEAK